MGLLVVGSTNPKFSHIVSKNPETIRSSGTPYKREVRKGVAYGWFSEGDAAFNLLFRDHPTESSFAYGRSEEFEYLDRGRYGSPYLPIALITTCLTSAVKGTEEDVPGHGSAVYSAYATAVIKVSNLRSLQQMALHYTHDTVCLAYSNVRGKYYEISAQAPTVKEALNICQVVCVLQCMFDPETDIRMNLPAMEKFIKVFNSANSPYYPRYLFQVKALTNPDVFARLKKDIEGPGMEMQWGDTRRQRFNAVARHLRGGAKLIDIGCGELFYSERLAKKYDLVYAIDSDEEVIEDAKGRIKGHAIENVTPILATVNPAYVDETQNENGLFEDADVLMTEVLEHMPKDLAFATLKQILAYDVNKVVATVPNRSFNQFYMIPEGETRHHDHDWEPTLEEFSDDCITVAAECGWEVDVHAIGDSVNDISCSTIAVFTKKPKDHEKS